MENIKFVTFNERRREQKAGAVTNRWVRVIIQMMSDRWGRGRIDKQIGRWGTEIEKDRVRKDK